MKKCLGFGIFFCALGMLIMLLIGNKLIGLLIIFLLLIVGYNFYHCE